MSSIFRLKFAYKYEGEQGEVRKGKTEIFTECETYTEAEVMVSAIATKNHWDRFGMYEYEILKTKFTTADFIDHEALKFEQKGEMLNNRIEHFFSGDYDGFFVIKAKFTEEDDKGNIKTNTQAYVVSEHSINQAINALKAYLTRTTMSEFVITDSKLDPADCIYLSSDSHLEILQKYEA